MGWWITLGIIVLLAALPLGISARYDADGAVVKLIAGPVKITLFPRPKKKPKQEQIPEQAVVPADLSEPKKEKPTKKRASSQKGKAPAEKRKPKPAASVKSDAQEKTAEPQKPEETKKPEEPQKSPESSGSDNKSGIRGGNLSDFLPLVPIVLDFLADFKRKLRVNLLELKLVLAADDPCDLAVNYGRAWAAVSNLLPRLERFLVIKKRNVDVLCDFTAGRTTVYARLDLTITLGRLLAAAAVFAFRALAEFLKIMNKRKGGTDHEPKSS